MQVLNEKGLLRSILSRLRGKRKVGKYYVPNADHFDIPRNEMPQIKPRYVQQYLSFLSKNKVRFQNEKTFSKNLKPTQNEFNPDRIKRAMQYHDPAYRIMISEDNYVLDGHHRWLAAYNEDNECKVNTIKIYMKILPLIELTKKFEHVTYKGLKG